MYRVTEKRTYSPVNNFNQFKGIFTVLAYIIPIS